MVFPNFGLKIVTFMAAKDIFHDLVKQALINEGRIGAPMADYPRSLQNYARTAARLH